MSFKNINIRMIMSAASENDALIVDVRTPEKYILGHIPSAVNIPFEKIQNRQITLPKSQSLIVYCDTGGASMQASRLLSGMGYTVINCVGGLNSYKGTLIS